jgi:hypothetical protein
MFASTPADPTDRSPASSLIAIGVECSYPILTQGCACAQPSGDHLQAGNLLQQNPRAEKPKSIDEHAQLGDDMKHPRSGFTASPSRGRRQQPGEAGSAASAGLRPFHASRFARSAVEQLK